jgi:hypothetical protein
MENTIDLLQSKINTARATIPEKSIAAIDVSNWKTTILLEFKGKYSDLQLEDLTTETELLLCGLVSVEEYPKELETRMHLSRNAVIALLSDMDKFIFKKIQKELERKLEKDGEEPYPNKEQSPDQRLLNIPPDIKQAITESNYQVNLYTTASKYKLTVEQMGILEEVTLKIILGTIHPEKYEEELASKITIAREDISNLAIDVNDKVLTPIREKLKILWDKGNEAEKDDVPLPPYKNISNDDQPIIANQKKENDNIISEIPTDDVTKKMEESQIVEIKPVEPVAEPTELIKDMMNEKLKGVTTSDKSVTDYSTPRINDPYREAL